MFRKRYVLPIIVALATVAACALMPNQASAAFSIRITTPSSGGTVQIDDNGVGDTNPATNVIGFGYSDASYFLIGSVAFTNIPGTSVHAILDINYSIVAQESGAAAGGPGTLSASATGFTAPTTNPLTLTSTINGNGTGTGTITGQQWADTANGFFTTTGPTPGPQGPFDINQAGGYGNHKSVQFNKDTGAFSITDVLTFNLNPGADTTGDLQSEVTPAPAPAGLLLLLSGAPVLGIGAWMRRRAATPIA